MTTKSNKNLKNKNKQNVGKLPIWDLSDLFSSIKSKKIYSDLIFIEKKSKIFANKYEGKVNKLKGISILSAISSGVGSRPISWTRCRCVRTSLLMVSIMCTGIRIVRAWSAMARVMACRIHQVA